MRHIMMINLICITQPGQSMSTVDTANWSQLLFPAREDTKRGSYTAPKD